MIRDWIRHKIKNKPLIERFWEKVDIRNPDECWKWLAGKSSGGYGQIGIKGKMYQAHRIAWELTYGEIPKGMDVLHICDNPPCCNPKCLFLGTQVDNIKDMVRKGRATGTKGIANGRAKLNEEQVLEIRNLCQNGMSRRKIAKLYDVSHSAINLIYSRKSWNHI